MNFSYSQASGWKRGDIRIWTRPLSEIPHGWQLCDGTNGTPNMIDRTPVGAGGTYSSGQLFGSTTQTPSVNVYPFTLSVAQIPSHGHTLQYRAHTSGGDNRGTTGTDGNLNLGNTGSAVAYTGGTQSHGHPVQVGQIDIHQPSIGVYWIMKVR